MSLDEPDRRPIIERALTASPLGLVVITVGFVLAVVFFIQLGNIAEDVNDNDVKQVVHALRLTVPIFWLVGALWGFQMIETAMERKEVRTQLRQHQRTLDRIEESLKVQDIKKQVEVEKSRSFWDKFRPDH